MPFRCRARRTLMRTRGCLPLRAAACAAPSPDSRTDPRRRVTRQLAEPCLDSFEICRVRWPAARTDAPPLRRTLTADALALHALRHKAAPRGSVTVRPSDVLCVRVALDRQLSVALRPAARRSEPVPRRAGNPRPRAAASSGALAAVRLEGDLRYSSLRNCSRRLKQRTNLDSSGPLSPPIERHREAARPAGPARR